MDDLEEVYESQEARLTCALKDSTEELKLDFRSIMEEAVEREVFKSKSIFSDELRDAKSSLKEKLESRCDTMEAPPRSRTRKPPPTLTHHLMQCFNADM